VTYTHPDPDTITDTQKASQFVANKLQHTRNARVLGLRTQIEPDMPSRGVRERARSTAPSTRKTPRTPSPNPTTRRPDLGAVCADSTPTNDSTPRPCTFRVVRRDSDRIGVTLVHLVSFSSQSLVLGINHLPPPALPRSSSAANRAETGQEHHDTPPGARAHRGDARAARGVVVSICLARPASRNRP
jgi:hypothetical protein